MAVAKMSRKQAYFKLSIYQIFDQHDIFFYPKWSHRLSKIIETFEGKGSYFALFGQNPAAYTRKASATLRARLTLPQSG